MIMPLRSKSDFNLPCLQEQLLESNRSSVLLFILHEVVMQPWTKTLASSVMLIAIGLFMPVFAAETPRGFRSNDFVVMGVLVAIGVLGLRSIRQHT